MERVDNQEPPIRSLWVFKHALIYLFPFIALLVIISTDKGTGSHSRSFMVEFDSILILAYLAITILPRFLQRHYFSYQLMSDSFAVKQGIIGRSEREIPYGVIQDVQVRQDVSDRIFGLAKVYIEDAADGVGDIGSIENHQYARKTADDPGSHLNQVNIPGLSKSDAENLRQSILNRTSKHSKDALRSGL